MFTLIHVVLSLIGIVAGLVVAGGLAAETRLDRWARPAPVGAHQPSTG